ncbi:segregation and condensation protein A [Orenia marismortui]|uniref:Segregation and condensation protein A n=1 Tax=Orenia marismortui TaxID=46469 RepID=A0A4R8GST2_9FIRM|nr:segregation/condensation protein A [Orenia marismortui]TDX45203.1 condensin subunit ScpA [Orenia marismortui]
MGYEVKIDAFQGPIDLLMHLLKKNKVEIYDIPISKITKQYLEYIASMKKLDLDVASEFLVMAAQLMEIKAQTLLPKKKSDDDEEEVDPRQELVEKLLEYKKYKQLAFELKEFENEKRQSYTRNVAPLLVDLEFEKSNPLEGVSVDKFISAFHKAIKRGKKKQEKINEDDKSKEKLNQLQEEELTIKEQQGYIMQRLILSKGQISFMNLFSNIISRLEIVVTFMALLELIKINEVKIKQDDNFDEIIIYSVSRSSDKSTDTIK